MEKRVHIIVRGLVHGVGFRMFIERAASTRKLTGWVRNLPDGTVEIDAQGQAGMIEELIADAKRGPSRARVTAVIIREKPVDKAPEGFAVIV